MESGLIPERAPEWIADGAAVVMAVGKKAGLRFLEFFPANIRNPNTRRA